MLRWKALKTWKTIKDSTINKTLFQIYKILAILLIIRQPSGCCFDEKATKLGTEY